MNATRQRITVQDWHFGATALHLSWPNPTSKGLMSVHKFLGSQSSRSNRVCSGVCVATHPKRFAILCTWRSTPMPTFFFHATCNVRYDIFGPTPGRAQSSLTVEGMSPFHLSLSSSATFFKYVALRLKKPTGLSRRASSLSIKKEKRSETCNTANAQGRNRQDLPYR